MVDPGPLTPTVRYKPSGRTSGTPTGAAEGAAAPADGTKTVKAPTPPAGTRGTPVKPLMSGTSVPTDSQRVVAEAGLVPLKPPESDDPPLAVGVPTLQPKRVLKE